MPNIKIITDSGCDLPLADAAKGGLSVLPFPIAVDGASFLQGEQFQTAEEFYKIMENARELPKTSQVTALSFCEEYRRLYLEGCEEAIVITINSLGSSTYQSALSARAVFYEEEKGAAQKMKIHVIDSKCYSIAYGYPALRAAAMAAAGASSGEILRYLADWFSRVEIFVAAYSLEYAMKSGRIGRASAVVGGALGVRPIIRIAAGEAKTWCKVRGAAAVTDKLAEIALSRMSGEKVYGMLHGTLPDVDKLLLKKMRAATGAMPFGNYLVGPAVALNIGPKMLGIGFLTEAK